LSSFSVAAAPSTRRLLCRRRLSAWYGGEEGGTAITSTLAGVNKPCGLLPVTPTYSFTDFTMKNGTYRYFVSAMCFAPRRFLTAT
jgi:beta-glucosidase